MAEPGSSIEAKMAALAADTHLSPQAKRDLASAWGTAPLKHAIQGKISLEEARTQSAAADAAAKKAGLAPIPVLDTLPKKGRQ